MKGTIIATALAAGAGAAVAANVTKKGSGYTFMDKSVVITGGSRGLGLIMARLLADEGARVTILARNQEELDRAAEDIAQGGADVLAFRCDVTDRQEVENTLRRVIEHRGRIDVLINNAGIIQVGPVEHMQLEDFEDAMKVHMWGPLYAMQAVIPHMKREGGGRIVNISSIGGKVAVPHLLPYVTSKFALVGLSDGMRAELAKDNIQVTTVAPGLMRTGSPYNALFKGDREKEFGLFMLLGTLPLSAMSAQRAARQIIEACRNGNPDLTTTIQARMMIVASTLFPGLFAKSLQLAVRLLPGPQGEQGDEARSGWESQSGFTRSPIMAPTHRAAEQNNERNSYYAAANGDRADVEA
ncbi:MAG: SDR family oxidoreductase [Chloroflexota bacterium]|nr:SDR family oxidoreductase [Chloroflexota bacterium]